MVFLFRRAGQLDAKRALVVGLPELEEDLLAQHFLRDAHADLRDAGRLLPLLHVVLQVIPQVEQPLPARYGDGLEIRQPVEELITSPIEQAEFRRVVCSVRGDDEVEVRWHDGCPFTAEDRAGRCGPECSVKTGGELLICGQLQCVSHSPRQIRKRDA